MNVFLGVLGVWILILTGGLIWIFVFFRRLSKDINKGNLVKTLEKILTSQDNNSEDLGLLRKQFARLEEEGRLHIQKIGLIRFNPFGDMGGDHSFSLALLDGRDDGFIITGLHTRERTRVYIKHIKNGESKHKLSSEESKALAKARNGPKHE